MTEHSHSRIVPGCYRCELGRDEANAHMRELLENAEKAEDAHDGTEIGDLIGDLRYALEGYMKREAT